MSELIAPRQLANIAPGCDYGLLAPLLSAAAAERQINTPLRLANWLGQLATESAGFQQTRENLNYSAERLMAVWPHRFPTLASAQNCAHNPDALAVRVYGARLGNLTPADAVAYVGRSYIMLTGRGSYALYSDKLGVDLIGHPDLAEEPATAARIAAFYWAGRSLNTLADRDDFLGITLAINGGVTGLGDRQRAVRAAKRAFGLYVT
jgi:putative chitinase